MTSNRKIKLSALVAGAFALTGCPGMDDNEIQSDGLVVHFAETHLEDRLASALKEVKGVAKVAPGTGAPVSGVGFLGGYDRSNIANHLDIHDAATPANLLTIYRAYLVVDEVHLEKCSSVADIPRRLMETLIPSAMAHGGEDSVGVGERGLDKLNVIDFVTTDEYYLALGDRSVAPGSYCGIHVSFARLAGDAYGIPTPAPASADDPISVPEIPDMTGRVFSMRADYCSEIDVATCITRTKVDIDDTGLEVPDEVEIEFDQPLLLDAAHREGFVIVGLAYSEWLSDIDITLLSSDANERQKLLNNIASSVHVYQAGLGDMPANVSTD